MLFNYRGLETDHRFSRGAALLSRCLHALIAVLALERVEVDEFVTRVK